MGAAVSYSSKGADGFSPTTDTLGRQCQYLLLSVPSEDQLLQCCDSLQPLCCRTQRSVNIWEEMVGIRKAKCFSLSDKVFFRLQVPIEVFRLISYVRFMGKRIHFFFSFYCMILYPKLYICTYALHCDLVYKGYKVQMQTAVFTFSMKRLRLAVCAQKSPGELRELRVLMERHLGKLTGALYY